MMILQYVLMCSTYMILCEPLFKATIDSNALWRNFNNVSECDTTVLISRTDMNFGNILYCKQARCKIDCGLYTHREEALGLCGLTFICKCNIK